MSYPASLIAHAFVKKGIVESNPVTQMKLQKLVYFAHGLHLAQYGEPLINENFQAWKFGPVVKDIYSTYSLYGSQPISDTGWVLNAFSSDKTLKQLDEKATEVIETTWNILKDVSAVKLSDWTHKEDSPWTKVYTPEIKYITIPDETIADYFKRFLVQS